MSAMLEQELKQDKKLLACGDGDSSEGSESEPSEDNLPVEEVAKVVPIVDKNMKAQLQKVLKKRAQDEKDRLEAERNKKLPKKGDESPVRSPMPRQRSPTKKVEPKPDVLLAKPKEEKKEEKKKPEMRDACTQTDRSDYQKIKFA